MGSLHVLTADYYPLSPRIEQAFTASKVLIEEVDLDELHNPGDAHDADRQGDAAPTAGRSIRSSPPTSTRP